MQRNKRQRYIDHLYAAVHTLSGVTQQDADQAKAEQHPCIKVCTQRKVRNEDSQETYMQLNPNKILGSGGMLRSAAEMEQVVDQTLQAVGVDLETFVIRRVDLAFNSEDPQDYRLFQKLNRLLICCLAYEYRIDNCYRSEDLWSFDQLSIAIMNTRISVENYDKEAESGGTCPVCSRLEVRSMKLQAGDSIRKEFLQRWPERWSRAIKRMQDVEQRYNDRLEQLYKEDLKKDKRDRDYLNLTAFLLQYKECIFSSRQMVDLLSRFDEVEDPRQKARSFKSHHRIEYFSQTDLKVIVAALNEATEQYFGSEGNILPGTESAPQTCILDEKQLQNVA